MSTDLVIPSAGEAEAAPTLDTLASHALAVTDKAGALAFEAEAKAALSAAGTVSDLAKRYTRAAGAYAIRTAETYGTLAEHKNQAAWARDALGRDVNASAISAWRNAAICLFDLGLSEDDQTYRDVGQLTVGDVTEVLAKAAKAVGSARDLAEAVAVAQGREAESVTDAEVAAQASRLRAGALAKVTEVIESYRKEGGGWLTKAAHDEAARKAAGEPEPRKVPVWDKALQALGDALDNPALTPAEACKAIADRAAAIAKQAGNLAIERAKAEAEAKAKAEADAKAKAEADAAEAAKAAEAARVKAARDAKRAEDEAARNGLPKPRAPRQPSK